MFIDLLFFVTYLSCFFFYSIVPTEIEVRSLGWTKEEDSVIAVVNYLYKDPYGIMIQKALEAYRPFPFQSTITAPSLPNRPQNQHQNQGKGITYGVQPVQSQSFSFPSRTTKHILDRVAWQQKAPQDEIFSIEEITSNIRFSFFLKEFRHTFVGNEKIENVIKNEIKHEIKNENTHENKNKNKNEKEGVIDNKKGFWTWDEREKVRTHLMYKKKNENDNNLSTINYTDTKYFKEHSATANTTSTSSSTINDVCKYNQDIIKEDNWDGKNKIFFSSGAKRAWWSTQPQPTHQNQPSSSSSNLLQLPSVQPTSRTTSSTFFPSFQSDQPTLDLDSYLFSNPGVDSDDLDLEFGFGVDERDEDFFHPPGGPGGLGGIDRPDPNSMILDENVNQKPLLLGSDTGSFCGRLVTERLFSFSSDYLRELDLLNNEGTPTLPAHGQITVQPQKVTKRINVVVANMKAAIKEAEGKKLPPPVIPGKLQHFETFLCSKICTLSTIEVLCDLHATCNVLF